MMRTLRSFRTFTCRCVFHTVVFTTLTSVKESEHILFRILVFHINHVWFISRPLRGSRDKQDEKLYKVTTPLWGFITLEIHNLKERKRVLLLFHQRLSVMSLKTSDLCEGMLDVVTVASRRRRRGSSISPVSQRQRKDTGCGLLNAGRPPLYCLDNMGDIWQRCWGLHPLSGAVSCAALKHCLHILMLIREKAAADVKHLVLFLCTCKEIMWPPLSSFHCFCSPACHKKKGEFAVEAIFFGGLHDFSCMWAPSVTEERPPERLRSFKTCRSGKTGGDAANKHRPGQTEASSAALTTASSSKSLLKLSYKKISF